MPKTTEQAFEELKEALNNLQVEIHKVVDPYLRKICYKLAEWVKKCQS